MTTQTALRRSACAGCYLYAILPGAADDGLGSVGVDGAEVRFLSDGVFTAVVSDAPPGRLRPERRKLAAHHRVLERLRERFTVLPVSFGVIADGPDEVRRILARHRTALTLQARRVAGRVEMGLRVAWSVDNVFEYLLNLRPELREERDEAARAGRQPSRDELVELGSKVATALADERDDLTRRLLGSLQGHFTEARTNPPRTDKEVVNLALLVEQTALAGFEQAVATAAGAFDDAVVFDLSGPWPPAHFVELHLES